MNIYVIIGIVLVISILLGGIAISVNRGESKEVAIGDRADMIPAIDADKPIHTEIATFALG